jgi:PAS domain S-box-containing protein
MPRSMMLKKLLKTRWPFIIFAVAVLLAIQILVTINYFYRDQVEKAEYKVDSAETTLFLQHDFSQLLQKVFLNQRSFVITGDEPFHQRYLKLLPQLRQQLEEVIAATTMSKKNADSLRSQHDALITFMNESIQRRQIYGDKIPVITARAKESFRRISQLDEDITSHMQRERVTLSSYKKLEQQQQLSYNQGMVAAAILSCFFLGALGYLLLKQQQRENLTQVDLKHTKERLDLAIHGANDGVWDWDLQTNAIYLSPRWKDIVGYTNDDMPNAMKAFDLLLHPEDRDRVWVCLNDYLDKKNDNYECTFRMRHKNGSWRWIMSRGKALWNNADDEKAYRMVGVHTDVTSTKTLEEKLHIARETAEEANKAKTDFLSHISHEIRTPLNAVIGISRILSQSKPLSEAFREHVTVLHTGAKNLQFLINDLLDLSRLDQGSLNLEQRAFTLRDMVEENIDLYRYHAAEKGIALNFETNIPSGLVYQGDSLRVGQIANNLLGNAVKFTDAGSVHITLNRTDSDKPSHDTITLSVEDTGIGIPHDQIKTVFNKFAQGDTSIARRYGGTGLGLSICRELCDLMGATIQVHSMEGQGSEFQVILTLQRVDGTAATQDTGAASDMATDGPRKVLLVEDYQPNIFVAEALLESIGFAYDSVSTGAEALAILNSPQRRDYVAALLDLQLPDMNGYMVAEETRSYEAQQGFPTLPLIAMTAHTSKAHQDRCMISGMNDYLVKPIDLAALEKVLIHHTPAQSTASPKTKVA